eukprot:921970_1
MQGRKPDTSGYTLIQCTATDQQELRETREIISGGLHTLNDDDFVCVPMLTEETTMDSTENKRNVQGHNDIKSSEDESDNRSETVTTTCTSLELLKLKCEGLCFTKYVPSELFYCHHPDCQEEQKASGETRMCFCEECGAFSHKKKAHSFDKSANYVKCLGKAINPDTICYENGWNIATAIKGFKNLQEALRHQLWFVGAGFSIAGPPIASHTINQAPTSIAACGLGHAVIGSAIGVAGAGCVFGVIIGTAIEWIYINKQLEMKKISQKDATRLKKVSVAGNAVSSLSYLGCVALGAALGTPGGPIGWVIGGIIGGILCGIGSRLFFHWYLNRKVKDEQEKRKQIQKEALYFFFHDENYDIHDPDKFNERKLKQTYHRLAVVCHPDMPNGDVEQWYLLSKYYGVLTAIFEAQEEENRIVIADHDPQQEKERNASTFRICNPQSNDSW